MLQQRFNLSGYLGIGVSSRLIGVQRTDFTRYMSELIVSKTKKLISVRKIIYHSTWVLKHQFIWLESWCWICEYLLQSMIIHRYQDITQYYPIHSILIFSSLLSSISSKITRYAPWVTYCVRKFPTPRQRVVPPQQSHLSHRGESIIMVLNLWLFTHTMILSDIIVLVQLSEESVLLHSMS